MSSSSVNQQARSRQERADPEPSGIAELGDGFELLDDASAEGDFEILDETDPLNRVRVRLRTDRAQQLRCVYCHETLARSEVVKCPACEAYVHGDCAALLKGCSTLGCNGRAEPPRAEENPQETAEAPTAETGLSRVGAWSVDLISSAAFGLVFAVLAGAVLAVALSGEGSALGPESAGRVRHAIAALFGLLVFTLRLRGQRLRRSKKPGNFFRPRV